MKNYYQNNLICSRILRIVPLPLSNLAVTRSPDSDNLAVTAPNSGVFISIHNDLYYIIIICKTLSLPVLWMQHLFQARVSSTGLAFNTAVMTASVSTSYRTPVYCFIIGIEIAVSEQLSYLLLFMNETFDHK